MVSVLLQSIALPFRVGKQSLQSRLRNCRPSITAGGIRNCISTFLKLTESAIRLRPPQSTLESGRMALDLKRSEIGYTAEVSTTGFRGFACRYVTTICFHLDYVL
jgi:hypothetical protein